MAKPEWSEEDQRLYEQGSYKAPDGSVHKLESRAQEAERRGIPLVNGWPDMRQTPLIKVTCVNGRHGYRQIAVWRSLGWDPSRGECGNWWWDGSLAVGGDKLDRVHGEPRKPAKRRVTEEEVDRGYRPGYVEREPKRQVASAFAEAPVHLTCACGLSVRVKGAKWQWLLDDLWLGKQPGAFPFEGQQGLWIPLEAIPRILQSRAGK